MKGLGWLFWILMATFCWGSSSFLYAHDGSPEVALVLFLMAELIFSFVCGVILWKLLVKLVK